MTEAEQVLRQTNRERSIVKKSAFNKRTGSRSKKCTLPSDYLSKKEREKLNGECVTWKLDQLYTLDEFKKMPNDIKVEWLNHILSIYKVGLMTISTVLFKRSRTLLGNYMTQQGLYGELNTTHVSGKQATDARKKFELIVEQWEVERGLTCDNKTTSENDIPTKELPAEPVYTVSKDKIMYNPETVEPAPVYNSTSTMTFATEFTSIGIEGAVTDLEQLSKLFASRKVRVKIDIEVI